ncbi:unnamed protein product [Somion occarium]|uniref:Uncharacterized protein n=1 Tax=Somion occarium TaxID=3059160 RepID=A0ABP1E8T9_9APHY
MWQSSAACRRAGSNHMNKAETPTTVIVDVSATNRSISYLSILSLKLKLSSFISGNARHHFAHFAVVRCEGMGHTGGHGSVHSNCHASFHTKLCLLTSIYIWLLVPLYRFCPHILLPLYPYLGVFSKTEICQISDRGIEEASRERDLQISFLICLFGSLLDVFPGLRVLSRDLCLVFTRTLEQSIPRFRSRAMVG